MDKKGAEKSGRMKEDGGRKEAGRVKVNARIERGMAILSQAYQIEKADENTYIVNSQSKEQKRYVVSKDRADWKCTCPDYKFNHNTECKHIHAVRMKSAMEDSKEFFDAYKEHEEKPFCPSCGSFEIEKHGMRYNRGEEKQRYRCKECGKRFILSDGFSKTKYTPEQITQALDLYFKGLSLRKVQDHFGQFYSLKIHHTTVLKWIQKYTWVIDAYVNTVKPELSDMWHVDEMMIKTGGKWSWLWHAMDRDTRFMVANAISRTRYSKDAERLFNKAMDVAGGENNKPDYVMTDGLQGYHKAVNKVFYTNTKPQTKHIRCAGIVAKANNNKVERLHNTVREREKVMRGMQNDETAQILMGGFRDYYNFVRPHQGIEGQTPAEAAGIDLELGRNRFKNLIRRSIR